MFGSLSENSQEIGRYKPILVMYPVKVHKVRRYLKLVRTRLFPVRRYRNRSTDILSFLINLRVLNSASLVQPLFLSSLIFSRYAPSLVQPLFLSSLIFSRYAPEVFFKLIMQFSQMCLLFYPIPEHDLPLSLRRNRERKVISRRERHWNRL